MPEDFPAVVYNKGIDNDKNTFTSKKEFEG